MRPSRRPLTRATHWSMANTETPYRAARACLRLRPLGVAGPTSCQAAANSSSEGRPSPSRPKTLPSRSETRTAAKEPVPSSSRAVYARFRKAAAMRRKSSRGTCLIASSSRPVPRRRLRTENETTTSALRSTTSHSQRPGSEITVTTSEPPCRVSRSYPVTDQFVYRLAISTNYQIESLDTSAQD